MSWTTSADLKAQLQRLWERGELLRDAVTGNSRFPLRLSLKRPSSSDLGDRFAIVRAWIAELVANPSIRLEWEELRHRIHGTQRLPASAWIDSADLAYRWLGKLKAVEQFQRQVEETRQAVPELLPWLERNPIQVLGLVQEWSRLLSVVAWMRQHPRSGIYVRQVDLPGVHSKFVESHRAVLAELLDLALPPEAINPDQRGASRFAARYGFLEKPARIRFRVLDPGLAVIPGAVAPDLAIDAASFSLLSLDVRTVFITENETNFLAFPAMERSLVLFGAGYGWEALSCARWLERCTIQYWGDIDTHGFAILDQLRAHFPHVQSFLMDAGTLHAHRAFWGTEDAPTGNELGRLTFEERALYEALRYNSIVPNLRLEQEHVGFKWVLEHLPG